MKIPVFVLTYDNKYGTSTSVHPSKEAAEKLRNSLAYENCPDDISTEFGALWESGKDEEAFQLWQSYMNESGGYPETLDIVDNEMEIDIDELTKSQTSSQ